MYFDGQNKTECAPYLYVRHSTLIFIDYPPVCYRFMRFVWMINSTVIYDHTNLKRTQAPQHAGIFGMHRMGSSHFQTSKIRRMQFFRRLCYGLFGRVAYVKDPGSLK